MPRPRALDYDQKMKTIMDAAAKLFAATGYPGARLSDVASACGASKSMIYHYFPTKDDLLFAMLKEHLETVIASLTAVRESAAAPREKFGLFLQTFIQKSAQSRQRNIVAMDEAKYLPKRMQNALAKREAQVVDLVIDQLRELNPKLAEPLYKPYALLLIGMLNWTDTWFSPKGPLTAEELVERITGLFLDGFSAA